jgi:hypothetical protein
VIHQSPFDKDDTTVDGKARWGDLPTAAPINSEEGVNCSTGLGRARHAFHQVGAYEGPSIPMYDQHAQGIRHRGQLDRVLEEDEWRLPTSVISADTWSRDINITAVDFDEMAFAVERALCEQHDISVYQSVDDRREELDEARQAVQSETTDSEESSTDTGGFEFPAASQ